MSQYKFSTGKFNPIVGLLMGVLFMVGLFWLAKGIFTILSWAFPVMIIATAIINYRVILGFGKWVLNALKINPMIGIVIVLFSFLAYPLVGMFLLFKALASRGSGREQVIAEEVQGEYINYEEVEVEEDFLSLDDIKKEKEAVQDKYSDLF